MFLKAIFVLHMSVKVSNLIIMCTNTSIYLVVKMKFISQTVLECGRIL